MITHKFRAPALALIIAIALSQAACTSKHKYHTLSENAPDPQAQPEAGLGASTEMTHAFDYVDKNAPSGAAIITADDIYGDHVFELAKAELADIPASQPALRTEPPTSQMATLAEPPTLRKLKSLESSGIAFSGASETPLIFDIPVTYNERVRNWIRYFQGNGRLTFKNWLQRSSRYLPVVQFELARSGLPQDLAFVAMIESGFTPGAVSHAGAKGMWQFIVPTAERYGLHIDWWIDERKDFHKATQAAIRYMGDLYQQFNSWYLVAASYNMGENGVRRLIQRHKTNNYWELAERGALPQETSDYVPKIIAAMLIAKAPALYGFRELEYLMPLAFETASVPGGTDIVNLASFLGVSEKYLKDLNPELTKGFIPTTIRAHTIRVPKGSMLAVSQFIRMQAQAGVKRTAAID